MLIIDRQMWLCALSQGNHWMNMENQHQMTSAGKSILNEWNIEAKHNKEWCFLFRYMQYNNRYFEGNMAHYMCHACCIKLNKRGASITSLTVYIHIIWEDSGKIIKMFIYIYDSYYVIFIGLKYCLFCTIQWYLKHRILWAYTFVSLEVYYSCFCFFPSLSKIKMNVKTL